MGWEERGVYYPLLLKDLEKYTLSITSYYTRYTHVLLLPFSNYLLVSLKKILNSSSLC